MRTGLTVTPVAIVVAFALSLGAAANAAGTCSVDYCVPSDWDVHANLDSLTPGSEPRTVIISAASDVDISEIKDALGNWTSAPGWCVSPETGNVGEGSVEQEDAWRSGGCYWGNAKSLAGRENHVRIWHQPIDGAQGAYFITASFETACYFVHGRAYTDLFNLAFAVAHWRDRWHCIDGGPGSFGMDGYDSGAAEFVADLTASAHRRGWEVTTRLDPRPGGTGLDGVKYSPSVHVVTIRKKAAQIFIDGEDATGDSFLNCANCKLEWPAAYGEPLRIGLDPWGGTPPYTWTIDGSTQPYDGLTIAAVTDTEADFPFYGNDPYLLAGELPEAAGDYPIPITVHDSAGDSGTLELVLEKPPI
jgi:hypothetical protein